VKFTDGQIITLWSDGSTYKNMKEIIVTENGATFTDTCKAGTVTDHKRSKYLQDHITQVLRAKRECIPVNGYFVRTLMDNFEWQKVFIPDWGLSM
jgi:beta-glucosidase